MTQCLLIPSPGLETPDTMGHREELLQPCSPSGYTYWVSENSENGWAHLPLGLLGHFLACLQPETRARPWWITLNIHSSSGEIWNLSGNLSTSEHTPFHLQGLIHSVYFIHLCRVRLPFLDTYFLTIGGWGDTYKYIHSVGELALTCISLAESINTFCTCVCVSMWCLISECNNNNCVIKPQRG